MDRPIMRLALLLALLAAFARAQAPAPEETRSPNTPALAISTAELPRAVAQFPYNAPLQAEGGTPPYHWRVQGGELPAGLAVDPAGHILGTPVSAGDFHCRVRVSGSAELPRTEERELLLHVFPPLLAEWKKPAAIQGDGIYGSIRVTNHSPDALDLTLIIVAVNETGKAFALGYQKITMPAGTHLGEVPFGITLPAGQYIVHVDAVGEDSPAGRIFRSRFQTGQPLVVSTGP